MAAESRRPTPMEAIPAIPALNEIAARYLSNSVVSADDVPVLLDIIGGLLALAGAWETEAADCDRRASAIPDSSDTVTASSAVLLSTRAQGLRDHARAVREAITAPLPEEE